jgi:isoquinoline 1-oxidoreductase beta subunit
MTAIIYFGEILVASSLAIVLLAISQLRMSSDAVLFAGGVVAWTLAEYVVHRFVLHGIAPTEHRQHHANPDGAVLTTFWQIWICFALVYLIAGGASGAARRLDAVHELPFLAHAAMEPMNCTVHYRKDICEIWVGTQVPTVTQAAVATLTGMPKEAIVIHNQYLGGGFGRRLEPDGTLLAVKIAKQIDGPVKVIWSREEDIQHDVYRPYYYDRISAGLDEAGRPIAWHHRVCGSSVVARFAPPLFKNGLDFDAVEGAAEPPYAIPNILVEYVRAEPPGITTGFWRGVGPVHNVFIVESFMDELASAARQDPVEFRRNLLAHNPRALAVLNLAVQKAGWGQPMPPGKGRGVSLQFAFGSYLSQVAEVAVDEKGNVRVERIVCAVDCGLPVNPKMIDAQIQSGTIFGLTAALRGAITIKDGRVEQGNFDSYPPLRIDETPPIETHSGEHG